MFLVAVLSCNPLIPRRLSVQCKDCPAKAPSTHAFYITFLCQFEILGLLVLIGLHIQPSQGIVSFNMTIGWNSQMLRPNLG